MVLGNFAEESSAFRIRGCHPLWRNFPDSSAKQMIGNSSISLQRNQVRPHNTEQATLAGLAPDRFGLFRVRSPLLTESLLFSLPQGTEMVHFPWFASLGLCVHPRMTGHDPRRVSPFGNPRVDGCLHLTEAFRSLPRPSSPARA